MNMGNLPIQELKIQDLLKSKQSFQTITLKRDGCQVSYKDGYLITSRGINRSDRFRHITQLLKQYNAPNMSGEMFIDGGNVFDVSSSQNWHRAKYMQFSVDGC